MKHNLTLLCNVVHIPLGEGLLNVSINAENKQIVMDEEDKRWSNIIKVIMISLCSTLTHIINYLCNSYLVSKGVFVVNWNCIRKSTPFARRRRLLLQPSLLWLKVLNYVHPSAFFLQTIVQTGVAYLPYFLLKINSCFRKHVLQIFSFFIKKDEKPYKKVKV